MPQKPLKPCRYPGCSELTEDRYCIKHQKEIDSNYDKFNRPFKNLYNSRWRKLRKQFLNKHPICEACREHGAIKAATGNNFVSPAMIEKLLRKMGVGERRAIGYTLITLNLFIQRKVFLQNRLVLKLHFGLHHLELIV